MTLLDKRLDKLAEPELPPVNPLMLTILEFALARPDRERLLAVVSEANRTGRLPADPLVLAFIRLLDASIEADRAGLFDSDYGERLYQLADATYSHVLELAAMDEDAARDHVALERILREEVVTFAREHLPTISQRAVERYLDEQAAKASERNGC